MTHSILFLTRRCSHLPGGINHVFKPGLLPYLTTLTVRGQSPPTGCPAAAAPGRASHGLFARVRPVALGGAGDHIHGRRAEPGAVDGQVVLQRVGPVGPEGSLVEAAAV